MLIAGNWKMHTNLEDARVLAQNVVKEVDDPGDVQVAVCPPATNLSAVSKELKSSPVRLGAQTMHGEDEGAFTGEISAQMLTSIPCYYVILGHSERRQYFNETDESVHKKTNQAIANGLVPIVCVGESLDQRKAGNAASVVTQQVSTVIDGLNVADPSRIVFAYEPIWAIGTGESASPDQAQAMHATIKQVLAEHLGEDVGRAIQVLYGGSMKPHNAEELLSNDDVDGGLIGGASLKAEDFAAIVAAGQLTVKA